MEDIRKLREGKKTVQIVGMAQTNRGMTDWDDLDTEIWTLNESPAKRFGYVKRVTRHFQLHPRWNFEREGNQNDPEHPQWLKVQDFPIYMQEVFEEYPTSVKYPLEEVFEHFQIPLEGDDHWREFDSTFPYMLALALYEGFDRIEIYGFEMGSETEWAYQRPNVHLWLGMARMQYLLTGKPEIHIPDDCRLMGWGSKMYGYEMVLNTLNPMHIEIYRNKMGNQAKELESKLLELDGRQKERIEEMQKIDQMLNARAQEIEEKNQDPKLKYRRLQELQKERADMLRPHQERNNMLQNKKMQLWEVKSRFEGGHLIMNELLDSHNSQRPLKEGLFELPADVSDM